MAAVDIDRFGGWAGDRELRVGYRMKVLEMGEEEGYYALWAEAAADAEPAAIRPELKLTPHHRYRLGGQAKEPLDQPALAEKTDGDWLALSFTEPGPSVGGGPVRRYDCRLIQNGNDYETWPTKLRAPKGAAGGARRQGQADVGNDLGQPARNAGGGDG